MDGLKAMHVVTYIYAMLSTRFMACAYNRIAITYKRHNIKHINVILNSIKL